MQRSGKIKDVKDKIHAAAKEVLLAWSKRLSLGRWR